MAIIGRKLLFHHPNVDDSVGTYVTDYALAGICYVSATILAWKILKDHFSTTDTKGYKCLYFLPWRWPGESVVAVTMATYASALFLISYGSVALFGGLPHQYLQKVPVPEENSTHPHPDGIRWLVSWRVAAGVSVVALSSILTLTEQLYQQEQFLRLPDLARKVFYFTLFVLSIASIIVNFMKIARGNDPYNITNLFLVFMFGIVGHSVATLILWLRACCQVQAEPDYHEDSSAESITEARRIVLRWDLILHWACPLLITLGGIFSFILTPKCSHQNAQKDHGCPLPDEFNHNAVMHLVHALGTVCMVIGELLAIARRRDIQRRANPDKFTDPTNEKMIP